MIKSLKLNPINFYTLYVYLINLGNDLMNDPAVYFDIIVIKQQALSCSFFP